MSATADLPEIAGRYSLDREQIELYRRDGHVLLRGVVPPDEVAAWRQAISETVTRFSKEQRAMEDRDTYGKAFLQITNLWQLNEAVRPFVLSPRFAGIAAELMGVDGVRLYHDQALYKEARGGHTPWHQDQYYWPLQTDSTITMWMPLVDIAIDMGPLTFASGSHHEGFLGHIKISDESEEHFDRLVKERDYPVAQQAMKAGDATFHSGWTLHSAPANNTDSVREVMTVIYYPDGVYLMEPDNDNRWNDLRTWFPDQAPGELAASPLNPKLQAPL